MNKSCVFVIASCSVVVLLVAAFAADPFICAVSAFAAMIFAALTAFCYCMLPNKRDYEVMVRNLEDNERYFCPVTPDGYLRFTHDELEEVFLAFLEAE